LITDNLPYSQVQTPHISIHIFYFLQKCKEGKPEKNDLPYLKTISQVLNPLSDSRYIAGIATTVVWLYGIMLSQKNQATDSFYSFILMNRYS